MQKLDQEEAVHSLLLDVTDLYMMSGWGQPFCNNEGRSPEENTLEVEGG